MERSQKIEEALSIIWEEKERDGVRIEDLKTKIIEKVKEDILEGLIKDGYITVDDNSIKFTKTGEAKARDAIRRQRLAERLLMDVLEVGRREMASSACEFEHILSKEVEESICTLLGHPKECPHGYPIPQGDCCMKAKGLIESIVAPLSKFSPGESGRVVYLLTQKHPQIHRLMSLGLIPGARISIHQIFPSFVIQIAETHLALEEDVANEIYVKRLR